MPPQISPEAVQRIFPFIKKLGEWTREMQMGRNFEHAVEANPRVALSGLSELVEPAAAKPQPWAAFKQSVLNEPFKSAEVEAKPSVLSKRITLGYGGKESPSKIWMDIEHDPMFPKKAELGLLESEASGRRGDYWDSGPRQPRPKDVPPVALSMADRKRFFDELMTRGHNAGIESMSYKAEGNRPALYGKFTSKKQVPVPSHVDEGDMPKYTFNTGPQKEFPFNDPVKGVEPPAPTVHQRPVRRPAQRFQGRGNVGHDLDSTYEPWRQAQFAIDSRTVPTYGPTLTEWARQLSPEASLTERGIETALMLSSEEALTAGLAVRAGRHYRLTQNGVENVRQALRDMGVFYE